MGEPLRVRVVSSSVDGMRVERLDTTCTTGCGSACAKGTVKWLIAGAEAAACAPGSVLAIDLGSLDLFRLSLRVYGLPLLGVVFGAALGFAAPGGDLASLMGMLVGVTVAALINRAWNRDWTLSAAVTKASSGDSLDSGIAGAMSLRISEEGERA